MAAARSSRRFMAEDYTMRLALLSDYKRSYAISEIYLASTWRIIILYKTPDCEASSSLRSKAVELYAIVFREQQGHLDYICEKHRR
jgi:hypothetical protein